MSPGRYGPRKSVEWCSTVRTWFLYVLGCDAALIQLAGLSDALELDF